MDDDYNEEPDKGSGDLMQLNEEFLKNHKELKLDMGFYYKSTIERIEKSCGCQVVCNPHFDGISFYVKNEYYQDAQNIIDKLAEEERLREERIERKREEVARKTKQKFDEAMARCRHPDDNEREFAEKCLKTLRLEDYVQPSNAEEYRRLYTKYSEYFDLLGWPDAVEGSSAKKYLNASFVRGI